MYYNNVMCLLLEYCECSRFGSSHFLLCVHCDGHDPVTLRSLVEVIFDFKSLIKVVQFKKETVRILPKLRTGRYGGFISRQVQEQGLFRLRQ